jgi:hypothetical protein
MAVALVFSRLSISYLLSRIVAGSASESCLSKLDFNSSRITLNSFCVSHEFLLFNLELFLLDVDDHRQELVLQTTLTDDEIDDGTLGSNFRPESFPELLALDRVPEVEEDVLVEYL